VGQGTGYEAEEGWEERTRNRSQAVTGSLGESSRIERTWRGGGGAGVALLERRNVAVGETSAVRRWCSRAVMSEEQLGGRQVR